MSTTTTKETEKNTTEESTSTNVTFNLFFIAPTKAETGVEMPIIHPVTGDETGAVLITLGTDSKLWKRLQLERAQKAINKQNRRGKKGKDVSVEEVEEILKNNKEDYSKLIKGWKNLAPNFDFSEENLNILLSDSNYDWLFDQHSAFVEDRANFF